MKQYTYDNNDLCIASIHQNVATMLVVDHYYDPLLIINLICRANTNQPNPLLFNHYHDVARLPNCIAVCCLVLTIAERCSGDVAMHVVDHVRARCSRQQDAQEGLCIDLMFLHCS